MAVFIFFCNIETVQTSNYWKEEKVKNSEIEKLYGLYYQKVYSYVMCLMKDRTMAEEITQNTFIKAMKSECHGSEYSWLCTIAHNLAVDACRQKQKTVPLDAVAEPACEEPLDHDTVLAIHRILHTLKEPYKEVFELRIFADLSFREIAGLFHKTESWARVTYHRARLMIRERMEANEP
jgi:RNA polymerase sigma-70 factor (ECF subfamily)